MIVFVKGETLTGGDPGAGMSREEISGSFLRNRNKIKGDADYRILVS